MAAGDVPDRGGRILVLGELYISDDEHVAEIDDGRYVVSPNDPIDDEHVASSQPARERVDADAQTGDVEPFVGSVLAVAGAAATMISAFLTDFGASSTTNPQSLLLVNSALTTFGYLFVIYSLVSYQT